MTLEEATPRYYEINRLAGLRPLTNEERLFRDMYWAMERKEKLKDFKEPQWFTDLHYNKKDEYDV